MKRYLGLDGGGTKTHVLLYDAKRGIMDLITGPASNYENMPGGYTDLAKVMEDMICPFLAKHGLRPTDIESAAFGMGGVDSDKQHHEISKVIKNLGFENFVLSNDAYLGVKAGSSQGAGVSCVNGSGYSVVGIGSDGEMLQVGGMGHVTGDIGGAYWLVPEAVSYAHGQLYKRYPQSVMTKSIMELIGISDKADFMEALHEHYFNGDYKSFALAVCKILFSAAKDNDPAAIGILKTSGNAFGASILGILDNLHFNGPPEIVLTGSLFQKYPDSPIVSQLRDFLSENYKKPFEIITLDTPSVLGALFWAIGDVPAVLRDELKKRIAEL